MANALSVLLAHTISDLQLRLPYPCEYRIAIKVCIFRFPETCFGLCPLTLFLHLRQYCLHKNKWTFLTIQSTLFLYCFCQVCAGIGNVVNTSYFHCTVCIMKTRTIYQLGILWSSSTMLVHVDLFITLDCIVA